MNIHRLERIARCTGSPILSLQNVLAKPDIIKQCEPLHFEKIVEEHNTTVEGGSRSAKTLLFLEGFPKPLGCTVFISYGKKSSGLISVPLYYHVKIAILVWLQFRSNGMKRVRSPRLG